MQQQQQQKRYTQEDMNLPDVVMGSAAAGDQKEDEEPSPENPAAVPLSLFIERQMLITSATEESQVVNENSAAPTTIPAIAQGKRVILPYRNSADKIDLSWLEKEDHGKGVLQQQVIKSSTHKKKKSAKQKQLQQKNQLVKTTQKNAEAEVSEGREARQKEPLTLASKYIYGNYDPNFADDEAGTEEWTEVASNSRSRCK